MRVSERGISDGQPHGVITVRFKPLMGLDPFHRLLLMAYRQGATHAQCCDMFALPLRALDDETGALLQFGWIERSDAGVGMTALGERIADACVTFGNANERRYSATPADFPLGPGRFEIPLSMWTADRIGRVEAEGKFLSINNALGIVTKSKQDTAVAEGLLNELRGSEVKEGALGGSALESLIAHALEVIEKTSTRDQLDRVVDFFNTAIRPHFSSVGMGTDRIEDIHRSIRRTVGA